MGSDVGRVPRNQHHSPRRNPCPVRRPVGGTSRHRLHLLLALRRDANLRLREQTERILLERFPNDDGPEQTCDTCPWMHDGGDIQPALDGGSLSVATSARGVDYIRLGHPAPRLLNLAVVIGHPTEGYLTYIGKNYSARQVGRMLAHASYDEPRDYTSGTFVISNLGMEAMTRAAKQGELSYTPFNPYAQSCIKATCPLSSARPIPVTHPTPTHLGTHRRTGDRSLERCSTSMSPHSCSMACALPNPRCPQQRTQRGLGRGDGAARRAAEAIVRRTDRDIVITPEFAIPGCNLDVRSPTSSATRSDSITPPTSAR